MSSRRLSLLLAAGSAVLLVSCSAVPPLPAASMPYFVQGRTVTVDRDYIGRYACPTGKALVCRCASTRLGNCDCSC